MLCRRGRGRKRSVYSLRLGVGGVEELLVGATAHHFGDDSKIISKQGRTERGEHAHQELHRRGASGQQYTLLKMYETILTWYVCGDNPISASDVRGFTDLGKVGEIPLVTSEIYLEELSPMHPEPAQPNYIACIEGGNRGAIPHATRTWGLEMGMTPRTLITKPMSFLLLEDR